MKRPLMPIKWQGKTRGMFDPWTRTYQRKANWGHFSFKHEGFGIQELIVNELKARDCNRVVVYYETEDGSLERWVASWSVWMNYGVFDVLREEDGRQMFLAKRFWDIRVVDTKAIALGPQLVQANLEVE